MPITVLRLPSVASSLGESADGVNASKRRDNSDILTTRFRVGARLDGGLKIWYNINMTKVSVIIPVYNVEKYLRQCIDSIVNQTLKEIEIICVDDGSTDSSPAILAEYTAKDPRVKVITREKSNAGAARNAGMAVATGEYLGFVDSDDWCELTLSRRRISGRRRRMRIWSCGVIASLLIRSIRTALLLNFPNRYSR